MKRNEASKIQQRIVSAQDKRGGGGGPKRKAQDALFRAASARQLMNGARSFAAAAHRV